MNHIQSLLQPGWGWLVKIGLDLDDVKIELRKIPPQFILQWLYQLCLNFDDNLYHFEAILDPIHTWHWDLFSITLSVCGRNRKKEKENVVREKEFVRKKEYV